METEITLLARIAQALETQTEMLTGNREAYYRRGWRDAVQELALCLEKEATIRGGTATTNVTNLLNGMAFKFRGISPPNGK